MAKKKVKVSDKIFMFPFRNREHKIFNTNIGNLMCSHLYHIRGNNG